MPSPWRRVLDWIVTIAVAVLLVLVFEAEVAKPYRVPSASMEPTLHCARPGGGCEARFSDRVIALRIVYRFRDPKRGEIAVFRAPEAARRCAASRIFIKRVIGLPGEQVSERNGLVLVDGKPLDDQYVPAARRDHRTVTWRRLADDEYFVMGDNRAASCDSRVWGTVPRSAIIGKVWATYWPPARITIR